MTSVGKGQIPPQETDGISCQQTARPGSRRHLPQHYWMRSEQAFLLHLAGEGNVAACTQIQALSALPFLYKEVLRQDLGSVDAVRAKTPKRLPCASIAWCGHARSGKKAIAGLATERMALHGERNSEIVMASNTTGQAGLLMYRGLTDSEEYNPTVPTVDPRQYGASSRDISTVTAIASNSRGEAGGAARLPTSGLIALMSVAPTREWEAIRVAAQQLVSSHVANS